MEYANNMEKPVYMQLTENEFDKFARAKTSPNFITHKQQRSEW